MQREQPSLLKNFISLTFLKEISRLTPLITTPFLVKVAGLASYGNLQFAKVLCSYFSILMGYGFSYTAARDMLLYKGDSKKIGELVGTIYGAKFVLGLAVLLLVGVMYASSPTIQGVGLLFFSYLPVTFIATLSPVFVFHGLNKLQVLAGINFWVKGIALCSLFVCIRSEEDLLLYPLIFGAAEFLKLCVAWYLLLVQWKVPVAMPSMEMVWSRLKEGKHFFFSRVWISLFSRLPTLFLGFFSGPVSVATYTIGCRICRSLNGFLDPLTVALFPIAHTASRKVFQVLILTSLVFFILGLGSFVYAQDLVTYLAGKPNPSAESILRLHAFVPLFVAVSNIVGIGALVPSKGSKSYSVVLLSSGILTALLLTFLVPSFGEWGAALSVFISEFAAALIVCFSIRRTLQHVYIQDS